MKNYRFFFRLFYWFLMLYSSNATASHLIGADLTYITTMVPGEYLLRLRVYRDCTGIPINNPAPLTYYSGSLNQCMTTTMPLYSSQVIPQFYCLTSIPTCTGGTGSIEEYVYELLVYLPPANDWTFHWSECCLNNSGNLVNASMYASCTINNLNGVMNNSPYFTDLDYHISAIGIQNDLPLNATEDDGDSLVNIFEVPDAYFACPGPVTPAGFLPQYSLAVPFSSSVPIIFDPLTGVLHFVPSVAQFVIIAIRTDEYRNGVLVGSVKRELQLEFFPFLNPVTPAFDDQILKANNGFVAAQCGDSTVMLTFDTSFNCASAVPNDFHTLDPQGIPNPVVAVQPIGCISGYADTLVLTFLNPLLIGTTSIWVKKGIDGNTLVSECGYEMPELRDTIPVIVQDVSGYNPVYDSLPCYSSQDTINLTDPLFCWTVAADGSDLRLKDANGVVYPINATTMVCPGGTISSQLILNFQLPFTVVNPLILYADSSGASDGNSVSNRCGHFLIPADTIAVLYHQTKIPLDLISDTAICDGEVIPPLICTSIGTVAYSWYLNGQPIAGAVQPVYQPLAGGIYTVMASGGGCTGVDSMTLTIHPRPYVDLHDSIVCDGDPWPLLSAGSAQGLIYNWGYYNTFMFEDTLPVYQTFGNGMYTLIATDTFGCEGIDSMNLIRNASPGFSIDPILLCTGQTALMDCGLSGAVYLWSTGDTTQTIQISNPGIYTLTVTANGCSSSDTAAVAQSGYPAAPEVTCVNGTAGYSDIYTWNPVPSAISYQVSEDGGFTWMPANTPVGATSHGVNNAPPVFVVRAIGPPPCDTGLVSTPTGCALAIPNIFTPNGDDINDFFEIRNIAQYPECKVSIHNRWGQEVFQVNRYDNHERRFDGASLPDGVYLFTVDLGNGTAVYRGTVAIYR